MNKDDKTIFIWPEGILPDVSQDKLVEFKWLFEEAFSKNHLLFIGINNQKTNKEKINYFNSLSIYNHNLDKKVQKIGHGNKLEKYNLNKLPSYINNNLDKFKDWID